MKLSTIVQGLAALAVGASAGPAADAAQDAKMAAKKVTVDTTAGSIVGTSAFEVESFRGIPFAEPPTGQLRLRPPKRLEEELEEFDGTGIAPACPQMYVSSEATDLLGTVLGSLLDLPILEKLNGQEDCLSISVQRPVGTRAGDKLPVMFWIFGGGFQLGGSNMYDGTDLLNFAGSQEQDFIFVAANHRVAGFGFMPGAEVLKDGSANLGLLDQRMALEWVADHIESFGGDPEKVTLWGESAGSISIFNQMALYDGDADYKGKPLFRGAIMNSGTIAPAEPVDCPKGQAVYDRVVDRAGCADSEDTLNCLREVDYETFLDAVNSAPGVLSYDSVALSYLPRPDGKVLPDSPDVHAAEGRYHAVPMITGDQEDEGTLFALFQLNVSSTDEIIDYLKGRFFHGATIEELTALVETWDDKLSAGSPFRTGFLYDFYRGFKRLAAILGDVTFTLTRRVFLEATRKSNPDVPSWSYLASYNYGTPIMGTFHASDLVQVFYGVLDNNAARSCRTYYFNFLHNLDPNVGVEDYPAWPEWGEDQELMWFETGSKNSYLKDDFRSKSADWIKENVKKLYI